MSSFSRFFLCLGQKSLSAISVVLIVFSCLLLLEQLASAETSQSKCKNLPSALKEASKIRQLEVLQPVPCKVLKKEEFYQRAKQSFSEEINDGSLFYAGLALKILGFIPINYDYSSCLVSETIVGIGAFYDEKTKEVVIPSWKKTSLETLVHESVHALQDQHFDLAQLKKQTPSNTDAALAFGALVEGDSVLVQQKYAKQQAASLEDASGTFRSKENRNLCTLPETLSFQYEFPYASGQRYAAGAIKSGGYQELDRLYSSTPKSTTEVMFVYSKKPQLADFQPTIPDVSITAEGKHTWIERQSDILGEFSIRTLLRPALGSKTATLAALGWRGDKLVLWERSTKNAGKRNFFLAWESQWHNQTDFIEFFRAAMAHFKLTSLTPIDQSDRKPLASSQLGSNPSYKLIGKSNKVRLEASFEQPSQ